MALLGAGCTRQQRHGGPPSLAGGLARRATPGYVDPALLYKKLVEIVFVVDVLGELVGLVYDKDDVVLFC